MKKTIILLCILLCITTGCAKKTDAPFGAETAGTTEAIESTSTTVPETQNKPELPTEQQEQKVSFLACGDNMVFYGNIRDAASQAGNYKYNFAPHYHNVKDIITAADISMINQETLMSSLHEYSYYPHFNSPREMGYALQDTGFDIVSIANNHMLDKGAEGLRSTIDFWNTQKVTLIGGYTSQDDCNNIRIVEKNGVKIAFLAYTEHTNGISAPAEGGVFIPYLSEEVLTKQISIAKNNADFVIISTHWGDEYTFTPND